MEKKELKEQKTPGILESSMSGNLDRTRQDSVYPAQVTEMRAGVL